MKIDVLGTSFTVQSDQDPSYLRDVTDFYKQKIAEIQRSVTTTDPLKIAILSGMLIVDEFFKMKNGHSSATGIEALEAARITQQLIKDLDIALKGSIQD